MKYYQIVFKEENPDTAAMIDAFANAYSEPCKTVEFTIQYPDKSEKTVDVQIKGLSYESDMPGNFLVKGFGEGINNFFYDGNCKSGYALPDHLPFNEY